MDLSPISSQAHLFAIALGMRLCSSNVAVTENFIHCACFELGVLWHSRNYRVHCKTRMWHDKNTQSKLVLISSKLKFNFLSSNWSNYMPRSRNISEVWWAVDTIALNFSMDLDSRLFHAGFIETAFESHVM